MNFVNQSASTALLNDVYNVHRKMVVYDRMIKLVFKHAFVYSNVLALELGLLNSQIITCAQEINVAYPDHFDLDFSKYFGEFRITTSGRNLASAELREAAEDDGGIPMSMYKRFLTQEFIVAATQKQWIRTYWKNNVLFVYKGDNQLEFESACYGLYNFTNGQKVDEETLTMLVDSHLLVPQFKIPNCLIRMGPNFPRWRTEMQLWCLEVLREMLYSVKLPSFPSLGSALQGPTLSNPVLPNPTLLGSSPQSVWNLFQVDSTPGQHQRRV